MKQNSILPSYVFNDYLKTCKLQELPALLIIIPFFKNITFKKIVKHKKKIY